MRPTMPITIATLALFACGGQKPAAATAPTIDPESGAEQATEASEGKSSDNGEFVIRESDTAESAQGATASKIKPTKTEAALKLFVTDKDTGPIPGVVVALTA